MSSNNLPTNVNALQNMIRKLQEELKVANELLTTGVSLPDRMEVFGVEDYRDSNRQNRSYWFRIGTLFKNKDHVSFSLDLKATPTKGRIQVRLPKVKENETTSDDQIAEDQFDADMGQRAA